MKKLWILLLGIGLLVPAHILLARDFQWGLGWGMTRTIWAGGWNSDGYPDAGNGAATLSLRLQVPYKANLSVVPFMNYLWSRHTTSYRTDDYSRYDLWTEITYFREIEVGSHLHYSLPLLRRAIYVGGGPSLRFYESGKRLSTEHHEMETHRGSAPTLALVGGWKTVGKRFTTFVEPQFSFSPDGIDRQKAYYAPDKFALQMGILWK
ncbi:MAG: hypothetical protein V1784_00210 [bacterium]